MPVVRPSGSTSGVVPPDVVAATGGLGGGLAPNTAIAIAVGLATECSCSLFGGMFVGFTGTSFTPDGDPVYIVTRRGSVITPLVEGDVPLTVDGPVFLSATAGRVSSVPPAPGPNVIRLQVGNAISATTMMLVTDSRFGTIG